MACTTTTRAALARFSQVAQESANLILPDDGPRERSHFAPGCREIPTGFTGYSALHKGYRDMSLGQKCLWIVHHGNACSLHLSLNRRSCRASQTAETASQLSGTRFQGPEAMLLPGQGGHPAHETRILPANSRAIDQLARYIELRRCTASHHGISSCTRSPVNALRGLPGNSTTAAYHPMLPSTLPASASKSVSKVFALLQKGQALGRCRK